MALPELHQEQEYKRQTFDRDAEFRRLYGVNASKKDTRKFNKYWNSDQRKADEAAFNKEQDKAEAAFVQAEIDKRAASWDARIAALKQQNADRGANALKVINASLASKPVAPATPALVLKDAAHWNQVAKQYGFKDYNAVAAWQKENGLTVDGKFGSNSYAKWAELNPGKVGTVPVIKPKTEVQKRNTEVPVVDSTSTEFVGPVLKSDTPAETPKETPAETPAKTPQFSFDTFIRNNNSTTHWIGGKQYARYDPRGYGDFYIDEQGNTYAADWGGGLGRLLDISKSPYHNDLSVDAGFAWKNLLGKVQASYNKKGGTMNRVNYFQQGGAAPQQDMQQQVVALVQAAMQGDPKATETVNKIMEAAKAGDQQALQLAQMIQEVAKQMQGQATAAKWGAKLGYIKSLKYAKGGKACPACEQKVEMKKCGGKKAKKKYFGGIL